MSTNPRQDLIDAQAQLERAQIVEHARQREALLQQLAETRAQLRTDRARYTTLRNRFYAQQQDRDNAQRHVKSVLDEITESWTCRPVVADLLPDDPEVIQWREQHEALEQRRDQLIRDRDALPDPEPARREAGAMEGPYGTIATLEYTEANLLRAIEGGSSIVRIEGGVYGVR